MQVGLEDRHTERLKPEGLEPIGNLTRPTDPDRAVERAEIRHALTDAIGALPEELRAVFLLSEISELSYAEISGILGCPVGTVGSRKHHAVERLRAHLRRHGHGL